MNIKAMAALKTYKNDSILLTTSVFCLYSSPRPSIFVTNDIPFTSANTDSKQKLQKIFYFTHFVRKQLFCYQLPTLHYPAVSFFVAHSFKS